MYMLNAAYQCELTIINKLFAFVNKDAISRSYAGMVR
jgi:hypothetical protein